MEYELIKNIPVIRTLDAPIADPSSAMDLLASVWHETGCAAMVLPKDCLDESFFRLSSGLAGEILQKFSNYRMRLAVVGDFSHYTSKPLKDFISECNRGGQVGFWPDEESALAWLGRE